MQKQIETINNYPRQFKLKDEVANLPKDQKLEKIESIIQKLKKEGLWK